MRCISCMTVNPAGNRFCENCGAQFRLTCRKCGHDCSPTARFCGTCGHSLTAPADPTPAAGPAAAPKWGELKQATVLFADIVGSTELIASMDPEQAMGWLRPAVVRMRASVERFGGTVVRTLGDGVMALFGVPHALEGHALLACEAALHMQKAFAGDASGLRVRVGLHSGQVASDPQDAQDGQGGGVHGLTIHLASRVVAMAEPGGICITEACRALAGGRCETRALGAVPLKGIASATQLHVLQDLARGHSPDLRLSPFRGRQHELDRLVQAMDAVERGEARVLGISGEPGAGKSRLCHEFALLAQARGVAVHEVRVQLYGHAMPLQPVLELVRHHFLGISPGEDAAVSRERIGARVAPLALSEGDLCLLHEFLGLPIPGAPPVTLGPKARQSRLLQLMGELVRLEARLPRLILIDDLHWLDEASEEFVSALVQAVVGTHTLLLLNYRPSYRSPWLQVPHFEQITLRELGPAETDALVGDLLAPLGAAPQICQLVVQRSGGNPFFAEELARALADSGVLSGPAAEAGGQLEAAERALPATVQAVVSARLDRIGEPEKTLLNMCAIIGKEIPLMVLEHVASPLAAQIQKGLDGLCHAQLILPQPTDGGRRFVFRHPLIQEVAYSTQLKVRRGAVHAAVALAMEACYREQLDEYAGLIAYHHEAAGQRLPAAEFSARAATWVSAAHPAQAIKHWRKVRALLQDLPRGSDVDRLRVTAAGKIALLGWREGLTLAEVKPLIDDALSVATEVDDRVVPWLLTIEGRMLVAGGGPADGYVDCARKALLYIDVDRHPGRAATVQAFLCQAYSWAGRLHEALQANDAALRHVAHVDAFDQQFIGFSIEQWILGLRGRLLVRLGRTDEARQCLQRMIEVEARSSEPPVHGMSRFGFVELAWTLGDADLAGEHSAEIVRLADKHGTPYLRAFALGCAGTATLLAQGHDEALRHFSEALALIRGTRAAMEYETEVLASLAECHLDMGRYAQAHELASQAIELAQQRSTRLAQCRAHIVRGAAARAMGADAPGPGAESDFQCAQELIGQTGAASYQPLLQRARAGLTTAARAA